MRSWEDGLTEDKKRGRWGESKMGGYEAGKMGKLKARG